MIAPTKLHFARFEFKYLLTADAQKELESELGYFLEFDPFVKERPDHQYLVRSLYFDDPHYTSFYDKIDGLHLRSKFRVRTYTNDLAIKTPQFLEVKGRYNNLVFKHRALISQNQSIGSASGEELISTVMKGVAPCEVRRKFEYDFYKKQLHAVALVDYLRRPFVSRFSPDFRLTFDSNLRATRTNSLFPGGSASQPRQLLPGYTVMEVKFRRHLPSWFHRLIQVYELQRVSISKICHAMIALGIAEDL